MRRRVPLLGPYAGRLCYVHDDGTVEPAPDTGVDSASAAPAVCLPEVPEHSGTGIEGGEIPGYDTRGSIARLAYELRQNGFARPEERARAAAASWDRGIRDGSIRRAV